MDKYKEILRRCNAALYGIAVGDAMGKMTEGYWPSEIRQRYGKFIDGFMKPIQPHSRLSWSIAEITDDTRLTILLAESILSCNGVDEIDLTRRILEKPVKGWPGWSEFKEAVLKGKRAKRTGNGGPTRVAPLGIIYPPNRLEVLVKDVDRACGITHNTRSALSAGCAIAAAFSAAIEGWSVEKIIDLAIKGAELGRKLGEDDLAPDVARRLRWLKRMVSNSGITILDLRIKGLNPGFQAWEGATFALALVMLYENAKDAILCAVNMGGDADSIAAMAGGILAARYPTTLPKKWIEAVRHTNNLKIEELAEGLAAIRLSKI